MMISFKSFEDLISEEIRIEKVLVNYEKYHAHTHKIQPFEKLHEHVHLVMDYALKLVNVHCLNQVLDRLINDLLKINAKIENIYRVGNFVKRLFVNSLIYHDYGKVNENFQIDKMKDNGFFKRNESNTIGSQHSILSAYVFLNIHLNEIVNKENISTSEKNFLIVSTYLFANPILKHHSSFLEHQIEFDDEKIFALKPYLKLFGSELSNATNHLISNISNVIDDTIRKFKENKKDFFAFYALLKLNFSLLTASDYYATNEFMGDMPINDFGVIDDEFRRLLYKNFINNEKAPYNGTLIKRLKYFCDLNFSELEDRNKINLNKLRQKMAAEAICTLRENINNKLFYLEAPTGGGKTNISFACTLELLKEDNQLNKVYYVFPFTTLITQTFKSIKETLQISNESVIQLHSKGGFHTSKQESKEDGLYGGEKLNYINNLFINYPFTLLSHVKFFDILKGNGKDSNYILHRISNSIVIIDELQTYTPKHWDKIIFFLNKYAKLFNIRVIIMSATLPKIDKLSNEAKGNITYLIKNKTEYFTNKNFKGRVTIDFSLLGKSGHETIELKELLDKVYSELELYAAKNKNSAYGLIEFIIKKSASKFYKLVEKDDRFKNYQIFLISGTILEPRRREILDAIGGRKYRNKAFKKSIIVTTQVIEAGVDIDMDLGFKDRSLVDSDEQLAGRVNRNASKNDCKVFVFNYDREVKIYGKDKRYEQKLPFEIYKNILTSKDFDKLYDKVHDEINKLNQSEYIENFEDYKLNFKNFGFRKIHEEFKLIESDTISVFVPLNINRKWFSKTEIKFLESSKLDVSNVVKGEDVFKIYKNIIFGEGEFIKKAINKKQIGGIFSKFMFSIYTNSKMNQQLLEYCDHEDEVFKKMGIIYLSNWEMVYSYDGGLDSEKFSQNFII